MRIRIGTINLEVELRENETNVITIENVYDYRNVVFDLYRQFNGKEGGIVLSTDRGEESFSKKVEVIINPFDISFNSKKILNAVYKEISDIGMELYIKEYFGINDYARLFLEKLIDCVPYELEYNDTLSMQEYLKFFDVRFSENDMDFVERIISYLKIINQVLNKNVVILVGIKEYLEKQELVHLYERCLYEKIFIVLIEHTYNDSCDSEKNFIIDKDHCIINVN